MTDKMKEMHIFGLGNPLLDITATVDDQFLQKYNLTKNCSVLAEAIHESIYEEVCEEFDTEYSAGGATQNTLRFCQWVVGKNNSVATFLGCVGKDYFGRMMEEKAKNDGVNVKYLVVENKNTGTCAVLITDQGKCKSLCANLGASEKFDKNFLLSNFSFVEMSNVIYTSGHMLSVSEDSVMHLAKHSHEWGKDFFFNLAAPHVSYNCWEKLMKLLPYIDYFFANAKEATAFATMKGYDTKDLEEVAKLISEEPRISYNNPKIPRDYKSGRVVIITRSDKPVIIARSDSDDIKEYPVPQLKEEEIKDTNGAGDAFTGGFLAMYISGKPLDICMKCAIYCAYECIKQSGSNLPKEMNFKP